MNIYLYQRSGFSKNSITLDHKCTDNNWLFYFNSTSLKSDIREMFHYLNIHLPKHYLETSEYLAHPHVKVAMEKLDQSVGQPLDINELFYQLSDASIGQHQHIPLLIAYLASLFPENHSLYPNGRTYFRYLFGKYSQLILNGFSTKTWVLFNIASILDYVKKNCQQPIVLRYGGYNEELTIRRNINIYHHCCILLLYVFICNNHEHPKE